MANTPGNKMKLPPYYFWKAIMGYIVSPLNPTASTSARRRCLALKGRYTVNQGPSSAPALGQCLAA